MQTTNQSVLFSLPPIEFFKTILTSPELLANGFQLILQFLTHSVSNRQNTLINLMNTSVPILTLVSRVYPVLFVQQNSILTQDQKQKTREYIVMNLMAAVLKQQNFNKKSFQGLIQFLNHFHNQQGYQNWVKTYEQLLTVLYQTKNKNIGNFMIKILKRADDRINVLSRHLLNFTIKNQALLNMPQQDSLQIIYYCIKSLSYLNGTDDQILQEFVTPHIQNLLIFIKDNMLKSLRVMKYSLKITTVLCGDYQVQMQRGLFAAINNSAAILMKQHISKLNCKIVQQDDLQDDDDQSQSLVLIIYQMIQLISTLTFNNQIPKSEYNLFLILCIPSLLLSTNQYSYYLSNTDVYLIDIQDQGQKSLRNKSISFLVELYESSINFQIVKKGISQFLNHFLKQNQANHISFIKKFFYSIGRSLVQFQFQEYHNQIFQQAVYFLLFNLTQQILQADNEQQMHKNQQHMIIMLGQKIKSTKNMLIKIGCINILNKIVKNMPNNIKQMYYTFLIQILFAQSNSQNTQIGLVLSIFRGFAYISSQFPLLLNTNSSTLQFVFPLLDRLFIYLLDKSIQQQISHIILEFLDILLKVNQNIEPIQILLPFGRQSQILSMYLHDGMISTYLIRIYSIIASQQIISAIYSQLMQGVVRDQNITLLVAQWIKQKKLNLQQKDIQTLLLTYSSDFVGSIIKNYLKTNKVISQSLANILNQKINSAWLFPLLSLNLLKNSQQLFKQTIVNITKNLISQYEIEKCLILPYYVFLKQPVNAINSLKLYEAGLYQSFINKIMKYAELFKGNHLRVVTGRVFLSIGSVDLTIGVRVRHLIDAYGKIEVDQWEDEQNQDNSAADSMFNMKFVNDQVEQQFGQAFGEMAWDSKKLNQLFEQFKLKHGMV